MIYRLIVRIVENVYINKITNVIGYDNGFKLRTTITNYYSLKSNLSELKNGILKLNLDLSISKLRDINNNMSNSLSLTDDLFISCTLLNKLPKLDLRKDKDRAYLRDNLAYLENIADIVKKKG